MSSDKKSPEKKPKNEKPLSLHPLTMEEALEAFMEVDPEEYEKAQKKLRQKTRGDK